MKSIVPSIYLLARILALKFISLQQPCYLENPEVRV